MRAFSMIIRKNLALILIVVLALFIRIYKINEFPPALNWDEVSHGYNAYSILITGKDEWGVKLPVIFEGVTLESGLKIDVLVEKCVIAELKSVESMNPVFEAQLMTYLRLSKVRLGFLINFNVPHLKDGIKRIVV